MKSKRQDIETKNKIGQSESIILKRMKPFIKPTQPHKHLDYFEIILITAGEGFHTVEFNSYNVIPPILFVLKPGQVHHWQFTEKPDGYVLMFKPEYLNEYLLPDSIDLNNINECIQLPINESTNLEFLFNSLEDEFEKKKEHFNASVASYLNIILIASERLSLKNGVPNLLSNPDAKFRKYKNLVNQYFREKKKVNQYAALLNISPKYLNEICRSTSGTTARAIIQNTINTEAKRLLIYTDKSISEIAFELGFEDSSHFAKFFRSQIGKSPKSFRQNRFQ